MRPRSSLWLSLYAGLSSLFVTLLYQAIKSFIALPELEQIHLTETVCIVSVGLFVIERLLSSVETPPQEGTLSKGRRGLLVRPLVVFVLLSISDGLLHDYLVRTVVPRGMTGIEQLIGSLIAPGAITYSWIHGVNRMPRRARRYGLYAAILFGLYSFSVVTIVFISRTFKTLSPTPGLTHFESIWAEVLVSLMFFSWLLTSAIPSGYLGGLAVDRGWCRHAWQSIAIALAIAASIQPIAIGITFELLSAYTGRKVSGLFALSFIVEPTFGNIGWALGLALVPDADFIFQSERTRPSENLSLGKEAAKVACITVLLTISSVIFSLACMAFPTRLILMAGSHSVATPSPSRGVP